MHPGIFSQYQENTTYALHFPAFNGKLLVSESHNLKSQKGPGTLSCPTSLWAKNPFYDLPNMWSSSLPPHSTHYIFGQFWMLANFQSASALLLVLTPGAKQTKSNPSSTLPSFKQMKGVILSFKFLSPQPQFSLLIKHLPVPPFYLSFSPLLSHHPT